LNAIIYARYSSDSQTENSIEGQLRECKEFAEKNGITIINTYIEACDIIEPTQRSQ
jgi:Resolvase, N terminal domain.